jgi:hypothetical protein
MARGADRVSMDIFQAMRQLSMTGRLAAALLLAVATPTLAATSATGVSVDAAAPSSADGLDGIAAALGLSPAALAGMRSIDADHIRAHVRYLADDLLEGRGTGTRGGDIAARYIATEFALDGLEPAGDDGGYFQKVRFTGVHTLPTTSLALQPARGGDISMSLGSDYVTSNQTHTARADLDAPVVFVGYGIVAPEYGWNDYRGVDVKGKVVLVIVNEPPSSDPHFFNGAALTYYGRWTYKFEEAARQGAIGALIVHRTDLASYGWEVVRNSWSGEQVYLRDDTAPKLEAASWLGHDVASRLVWGSISTSRLRSPERASSWRGNCRCGSRVTSTARCVSSSRTTSSVCCGEATPQRPARSSCIRRITITSASIRRSPATRSTMVRSTTARAAACCSSLRMPSRPRVTGPCIRFCSCP